MANKSDLKIIEEAFHAIPNAKCSVRGSGKSMFLYIFSVRAAEVSVCGNEFWIEYWDVADLESDEPPVKEKSVQSITEVISEIKKWI